MKLTMKQVAALRGCDDAGGGNAGSSTYDIALLGGKPTVRALNRRGLVELVGEGYPRVRITARGRKALAALPQKG